MGVCSNLEPKSVFKYFEDICGIPHGSGNEKQISDYLVNFAKEHELKYIQDEAFNVIIFKNASIGYENEPAVILQGHMDMVAVAEKGCPINMKKDGLELIIDGDYLTANGTTLGGDDGIAVAMALAILDDDMLPHPPIEAVFTVDEEVGMLGAARIDTSVLKGKKLLNIDNEEEGYVLTGCAGGARASIAYSFAREEVVVEGSHFYEINVSGGLGGHSGTEIDKGRANAIIIAGRILKMLVEEGLDVRLMELSGGAADNAIPGEAKLAIVVVDECDICQCIQPLVEELAINYKKFDSKLDINIRMVYRGMNMTLSAINREDTHKIAQIITTIPNGIQAMSKDVDGLVETSLNLGMSILDTYSITFHYALRSSVDKDKEVLMETVKTISEENGAICSFSGVYPGWKYRKDSPLREKIVSIYKEMYGTEPEIAAIHAGLECGFFAEKIEDLDCVSIGPNILDIHSPAERLDIQSTKRCFEMVCRFLACKNE